MDVFLILQFSRSLRLHHKWFLGKKQEKKKLTFQETQADQIF